VILLFHSDIESPAAILQKMINEVHIKYPIRLTVSTGIMVTGVLDAVTSYHSAVRVLEQLRPLNRKSLLTIADLEEGTSFEYYYPLDLEKELIQSTLAQSENEVSHIIDSLLRGASFSTMNTAAYVQFTYSIHSTLHRIAQQLNCLLTDIFEEAPFQILQQCDTLEVVRSTLLSMFAQVMELASEKSKSVDQKLADSLTKFIHTHYDQDIALTDLAHYVKMSPSYISTLFKLYHGDSFKDYLNNYRVTQAKLLIEQGEHKVTEISTRVGCNNVNTFIRIFKKEEGIPPGQYILQKYRETEE
jgi:two-component system response regulator YesN